MTEISRENFRLPRLAALLTATRTDLLNGKGFVLYKGLPVNDWGLQKSTVAHVGLSTYIGYTLCQNASGHILVQVTDAGDNATQVEKVRLYRTNVRHNFHVDPCDVVGLLSIAGAQEGGEFDVCSSHHVWNILQAERPDVAEVLTQPVWYFDRKGMVSHGEEPYIRAAIFYLETPDPTDPTREQRVYCKWDTNYTQSARRFSDAGVIPPPSAAQLEAAQVLEDTCNRVRLRMIMEPGDVQYVTNSHLLHARTAYRDYAPESGMPRRNLIRLWLGTPQGEGGWRLPFWDSEEKRRGGMQVGDTPPVGNMDAS